MDDQYIKKQIDDAVQTERERCAAIVQLARHGEIDTDWRSIIHRIESGLPAKSDAEEDAEMRQ